MLVVDFIGKIANFLKYSGDCCYFG